METKRIKLYLIMLVLLSMVTALITYFLPFQLHEGDLPIPVMVTFTVPAFLCIVSLLSTNGFRNFRLDLVGVVSSGIWVIVFVGLMCFLYFYVADALRYPDYSRQYTAIILVICLFIGILPLIALHDTYNKNAKQFEEQGKTPGRIWRNLQYSTLAAATMLVAFAFAPGAYERNLILMFIEFDGGYLKPAHVLALFLFLSLSLTAIFLLTHWLWQQAKIASVLSAVVLTPILIWVSYFYIIDHIGYFEDSRLAEIRLNQNYKSSIPPQSETTNVYSIYNENNTDYQSDSSADYEENDEYYNESDEETDPYNPQFIADGIIGTSSSDPDTGDTDSIYAAVHYFARYMSLNEEYIQIPLHMPEGLLPYLERSTGSGGVYGYGGPAYEGLIKFLWENRKNMVIKGVFQFYTDQVEQALPYETYRDNGYEQLVNQLITAYEEMEGNTNTFREIYALMDEKIYQENAIYDAYDEYYKLIKPYVTPVAYELFRPEEQKEDESDHTYAYTVSEAHQRLVWVYSFWARRNNDGIAANVYEGLLSLRNLYGSGTP